MNQKNINQIDIHPLTHNPTEVWNQLSKTQIVKKLAPFKLDTKVKKNAVRFVCMSDTHSMMHAMGNFKIPPGDVYIHAGDFTKYGSPKEVADFNNFLGTLPHRYKIVIAGNHDSSFDPFSFSPSSARQNHPSKEQCPTGSHMLTKAIYLEDSGCEVYGIKVYGTPWQPEYCNCAFNLPRGQECLDKWNLIPDDTQVLITHSPPLGHGDFCISGVRAGCVELLSTVQKRVKPKYHIFGHIHEGYGITTDKETVFINASTCNIRYLPVNLPIIFDFPLPEGHSKDC